MWLYTNYVELLASTATSATQHTRARTATRTWAHTEETSASVQGQGDRSQGQPGSARVTQPTAARSRAAWFSTIFFNLIVVLDLSLRWSC